MSKSFAQFKEVVKARSTIYDLDSQKRKVETPTQHSGVVSMDHLVPPRPKITRKKPTTASPNETLTSDSTIKANGNEKRNSIQSNSSHYTPNEKSHASTKESDNNHRSETQSVSSIISADPAWAAESISFNHTSPQQKTQQSPNHRQPRSREQTIDSIQFTKRMPGAGSFEDIKSEAINSWGEGVDLELESGARAKKRADWLAPGDFFASTTDSSNSSESHIKNDISAPAPMHPTDEQQSYASVAKQKTPAWAIENSTVPFDTHTTSFTQTTEWRAKNQLHHISPQVPHMAPLVVMPSGYPYLPMANGFAANPNSSNPAPITAALMVPSLPDGIAHPNGMMLHDERDMESGLYLISFLENHDQKSTLIEFQKRVGHLLHHRLPEFSMRNFSLLVDVLAIAMEHEIHHKAHSEIARKIKEVWGLFKARLIHYTQAYAYMPTELEGLLQFSMALSYHEPKLAPELPVSDYLSMYQRMSKSIASDTRENLLKYLYKLKTITASDKSADNLWDDAPSQDLPLIPNASLVITEVSEQVNLLKEYQDQHGKIITNQTNPAWSDNISDYFVAQFLLLREEMIGPAKKVMNNLFRESSDQHYSEYQHASPKALTLLASSSEPAVVFQLGHVHATDNPMLDFQEGYLVFLLPERDLTSKSQRRPSIKSVADKALMGQAIRASMRHNALGQPLRIVSIHINKNDLSKLNWSKRYTLITSPINAASTLSTLEWLYESCYNLDIKKFSFVLTPRLIAATNILSSEQMKAWEERYANSAIESNADAIPDYIGNAEIDVSCIMTRTNTNHRACPGTDSWPSHPPQVRDISSKLPSLYCLSPSQLKSVKFALTHRIAIISGAPGTGKTFLASKLAQLLSNALTAGQFHQPVLVIAKSQSSLDDILSNVVSTIPNIVRFGGELHKDNLVDKQITRQATLSVSDPNYRQHQHLERQLARNQAHLNALLNLRAQIADHDPSILSTSIPPSHRQMLEKGFVKAYGASSYISDIAIWSSWASHDKKSKTFDSVAKPRHSFFKSLQWQMESAYVKRAGRGLLPLMDHHLVKNRFASVANMSLPILPITSATRWPFESSENQSGSHIRTALMNEWKKVPADRIWTISEEEKTKLIEGLVSVMVSFIDKEIQHVMQEQVKAAQAHDDNLIQKWLSLCRFNRIIGMTADFASAHREFLANLWPRSVIVDEASEILESTVSSIVLGPRTEHVILLGTSDCLKKPRINNDALAGEPHQLDISLFERWKLTNIEKAHLEEQWRMHSEVASVVSQFNARKKNGANSLLITAPLASRDENLVDGKYPAKEALYGITQRALYVHYKPHQYNQRDDHFAHAYYSRMLMTEVTNAQVDEARFVASFGTYLSQQPYPSPDIAILTISNLQKSLIRAILKEEIPKRTCFVSNIKNIAVETVDQYLGRQNSFTILSTATPGHSHNTIDNVSHALTRAKYGLFVVGQPDVDGVHPQWKEFAKYMQERGLYSHSIRLTCHTHGDTINAKHWKDFLMMKNGGCQNPCGTLMNDGHVCKEECHFLSHSEVICHEPCNRLRPTGCAHACRRKCYECTKEGICPPCTEEIEVVLPCGHKQANLCHRLQGNQNNRQQVKCHEIVKVELPCGHTKQIECYLAHQKNLDKLKCDVKQSVTLACGHTAMSHCGVETICAEPCKESLECGHKCKELCGMLHSHSRSECTASCPKQLICGHMCAKGCANPDQHTERCIEKCNYTCSHGYKCSRECYKDCIRCISECPYRCAHYKCTKKCFEICDRPPCEAPCRIKLSCGHKCSGLCGENCPPCMICENQLKCSITLRHLYEFEEDEKIYQLPECGCVFAVEALDAYFETQAKNGEHTAIKLWQCPECQKPIYTALRYSKYIKIEIALVNAIKIRMEKDRQKLTHHEREQIINAMNDETRHHRVYNIVGGRWFVCENQHPYYVGDCGGATEISKCPECDAPIGGTKHRVVESNRFYGEFDGSEKPAWPAQPGASSEG
ncbi:hypothetical protein EDC96DRAFT_608642 [Choanephora cucurbitarum]|nr:hypothetical protein EDC96DRAFT_608642 [Choanephora cucurbitarum]